MKNLLKKSIALVLTLVLLSAVFCVNTSAAGFITYKINDYGYAEVVSCDTDAYGTVVVPSKVEINGTEYEVRTVGASAFADCINIETITISEGITQIENKAFENCVSLKVLDVPKSLISCQYDAFDGCNKVTVNCYTSNVQFFAVYGFSSNIEVNIVDSDFDETTTWTFNRIVEVIRKILMYILQMFKNGKVEAA